MRVPTERESTEQGTTETPHPSPALPRFACGTQNNFVAIDPAAIEEDIECLVHDLKSPLSTISLAVDVIETAGEPPSRAALTIIRRNLDFLNRLVRSLLDVAHTRAVPSDTSDLGELIEHAVETVPLQQRSRVVADIRSRVRAKVDVDQIGRVIANLLGNALAHAPGGSVVVVRLEACGNNARISVIDRGPGLRFEDLQRIFDKYERGRSSAPGTGLGLYLCRKIVERHGGRIAVETSRSGSRFFFDLPTT